MPSAGDGAAVYARFVDEQLAQADRLKDSFEARAISLASVTGTLATALFAVIAILGANRRRGLPVLAEVFVVGAALSFTAAVILALRVLLPRKHVLAGDGELRGVLETNWGEAEAEALWVVAHFNLKSLNVIRARNGDKARRIRQAVLCHTLAVAALTVSVAAAVWR
jgi:hypothetical protein